MKNLKSIIAILAISLATTFSTNATEKDFDKESKKITQKLRTEIVSMLGSTLELDLKSSSTAEVSFMVNNDNELVVVSVDSKVREFKSMVKNKLNYKKINVKGAKKGEIYRIPVKLKAS